MNNLNDIKLYDYNLPEELIAQSPLEKRENSRLLVLDKQSGKIKHSHFYNIVKYLNYKNILVLNNTKVLPSRLIGFKSDTNAKIEILLLKEIDNNIWECLVRPQKRVKVGTIINFADKLKAICTEVLDEGITHFKMEYKGIFIERLNELGEVPLPPYIKSKIDDANRYQTVYASSLGSSAAPTAGLHFTENILNELKNKEVTIVYVTLHIGLGTFRPVSETDITLHHMHSEYYEITDEAATILNKAKKEGKTITCVGTTSLRTIESNYTKYGMFKAAKENTNIYIYPPYKIKSCDELITNFHLPKSTLLMLVSAFTGRKKILKAYSSAIKNNYRFFSFGDAMYIRNNTHIRKIKTSKNLLSSYKYMNPILKTDNIKIYNGNYPILLTSVHAYKHSRNDKLKKNELNLNNLIKILKKYTDCHIIYKYKEDDKDYNYLSDNEFNKITSDYIKENGIKYLLDFHGMCEKDYKVEIGTNNYKNINEDKELIKTISEIIKNNMTKHVIVDNKFKSKKTSICKFINEKNGIKTIQFEIDKNYRKLKRKSKYFNDTVVTFIKIINFLKEEIHE